MMRFLMGMGLGVLVALTGCASSMPPVAEPLQPKTTTTGAAPGSAQYVDPLPMAVDLVTPSEHTAPATEAQGGVKPQYLNAHSSDLRVMTFNLRVPFVLDGPNYWDFRKGLTAETIRNFNPDILGTQECLSGPAGYLREQLSDYTFVGVGRDDGKTHGEMCGMFFKTARFEKLDSGHFWLSETPQKPGSKSWGASYTRMASWVKLQPRDGGPALCWINTHFDNGSSHARVEEAHLLRHEMDVIAPGMPMIVTGDFNADYNSEPYKA